MPWLLAVMFPYPGSVELGAAAMRFKARSGLQEAGSCQQFEPSDKFE